MKDNKQVNNAGTKNRYKGCEDNNDLIFVT